MGYANRVWQRKRANESISVASRINLARQRRIACSSQGLDAAQLITRWTPGGRPLCRDGWYHISGR